MTIKSNTLRDAINIALCVGASTMMSMGTAFAQDATPAPAATDAKAKNLDTITVTGSRVRRVETETASPVLTVDRKAIEKSGKMTIGEIVNDLPNISGAPTTTAVNNGGGTGAATAELRGLGSNRTLVLIDGHRPGPTPIDLNSIPLALVERIEVLTEGSSTVYGSDAIGGVINFIMRKNYNGAQFTASYGESGRHDSERKGQSLIVGQSGDKGNVVAGLEYNKFDSVPAGNREFSKDATYLLYGTVQKFGSSRNPYGRISLPASVAAAEGFGACSKGRITLKPGWDNNNPVPSNLTGTPHLSDFQCFDSSKNTFNYQPFNVILSPQERTNAFALATYNVTEDIAAYADFYHQKQTSASQIAPLAFDALSDNVTVSKDSIYNPFGVDIGAASGNQFLSRFLSLGDRRFNNSTTNDTVFLGLKGNFGQTWSWDAGFDYNHFFFITQTSGYVNLGSLAQALGPSKVIGGVPTCLATAGDPTSVIANCTPVNLFNIFDPATIAALKGAQVSPLSTASFIQRELEINASGDLFDLPAGAVKLAVGADSIRDYQNNRVDPLTLANPVTGSCGLPQETCSTPIVGAFSDKEVYAELFVPILKDAPFAYALNLDIGSRYSKYNLFKGNDSNKLAIEWRPIKDLLVRASASDVFRAPSSSELFAGAAGGAFPFAANADPCIGLKPVGGNFGTHDNACGAPRGTVPGLVDPVTGIPGSGLSQVTGVSEGASLAGFNLQPEKGRSYDFGFVYDPQWVPGLSTSLDYYRVNLKSLIVGLDPSVAARDCFDHSTSPFCQFLHRGVTGELTLVTLPTVNLGSLTTSGFDIAIKYKLPVTPWGQFSVSTDLTHINKYDVVVNPASGDEPLHIAGHYRTGFGNYMKWRGDAALNWSMGDWDAGYRIRWVGKGQLGDKDLAQNTSADGCTFDPISHPYCLIPRTVLKIPNYFESFVTAGYNFGQIGTMNSRVDVGVDNVFDKQPPQFFQNNVTNANVDVNTYDTIGRLFWARFTAKF